jgi:hypothetical protein
LATAALVGTFEKDQGVMLPAAFKRFLGQRANS